MAMKISSSSSKLLSRLFFFTHPSPPLPPLKLSHYSSSSSIRSRPHRPPYPSSLRAFSHFLPAPGRMFAPSLRRIDPWQNPKLPQRLLYPPDESSIFPMLREQVLDTTSTDSHQYADHDAIDGPDTTEVLAMQHVCRLLRLVQVESIKEKLKMETEETMHYTDFLRLCRTALGAPSSTKDAKYIAKALDDAGVVLIFQDVVYLRPNKVARLVADIIPKPGPPRAELLREVSLLEEEKKRIDQLADKHSRRVLWYGLGYFGMQTAVIFRLTFWELSWDVMEPIAYFATTFNLLIGYAFFMATSREPNYQDIGRALFSFKQQKLMKKQNFDADRFSELQKQCRHAHFHPH